MHRPIVLALIAALLWGPLPLVAPAPVLQGCPRFGAGDPWGLLRYVASGQELAPLPAPQEHPLQGRDVQIIVDAQLRRLFLMVDGRVYKEYPVAVGTPETPTPIGHWRIAQKAVWGGGFGARWMGLSVPWGRFGIHGTNNPASIGTRASHGCVRMFNRDVIELYNLVEVGTPVTIRNRPTKRFGESTRHVCPTILGTDIYQMQQRLHELGYYDGPLDGQFAGRTEAALRAFQRANGLQSENGCLGPKTYEALRLRPYADDPDLAPGRVPPGGSGP